jgi:hypothetical protein
LLFQGHSSLHNDYMFLNASKNLCYSLERILLPLQLQHHSVHKISSKQVQAVIFMSNWATFTIVNYIRVIVCDSRKHNLGTLSSYHKTCSSIVEYHYGQVTFWDHSEDAKITKAEKQYQSSYFLKVIM